MSKVFIEETTLSAIGSAIREMTGKSDLIAPTNMPTEIRSIETGGGGSDDCNGLHIPEEALIITGDCGQRFSNNGWNWYVETFGDQITTKDITNLSYMFQNCSLKEIPFDINISYTSFTNIVNTFSTCARLEYPPLIKGDLKPPTGNYGNNPAMNGMFQACHKLRYIPYDYFNNFGGEEFWTAAQKYSAARNNLFYNCYSLRQLPDLSNLVNSNTSAYSHFYYGLCAYCYVLDEIINLPVSNLGALTSNCFQYMLSDCGRLKELTFATDNGTPKTAQWKSQIIDLQYSGYLAGAGNILNHNSGITADKEVKDDATYQALKNDPDWYATKLQYSRYNHDSAVNTINSLPDTSAYGTNTIKFKGAAGSATDGGAINTLTEEEIAVAAAKGWTVSFV